MTKYTINHLRDVQDLGPALGVETAQEVRFPQMDAETTGLSLMRVKPGQRQAVAHHHTKPRRSTSSSQALDGSSSTTKSAT